MTEIPEHLLKRSKQRRQAMGLGDDADATPAAAGEGSPAATGAGSDAGAEAAPARAVAPAPRSAAAAPPPPPVAPPDPPYVAAAKSRRKVPMWAAPVLALLPLWGFIYYQSLQKPGLGADDPLTIGAQVYNVKGGCAGCHGVDGSGGVGAVLKGGATQKTFPNPLAMVHWLGFGAAGGARPDGTYGDINREGGPHNTSTLPGQMPAFKDSLTPEEIAAVTIYVREKISGGDPEKGFSATEFPTLGEEVTKVLDLGPGGDPDVPGGSSGTGNQPAGGAPAPPGAQPGGASAGGDAGTDTGNNTTGSAGNSTGTAGGGAAGPQAGGQTDTGTGGGGAGSGGAGSGGAGGTGK